MPKYKNVNEFIQPVAISGKRYIVRPGEVIFSERELDTNIYTFLAKVDDTAPVSQITAAPQRKVVGAAKSDDVNALGQKLEELRQQVNACAKAIDLENVVKHDDLNKKLAAVTQNILEQTPHVEEAEIHAMAERIEQLKKMYEALDTNEEMKAAIDKITNLNETMETVLRRLEVMKKAVETINQALHNLEVEVYEHGGVVIVDAEEPK